MRETTSNGQERIYLPKDKVTAINKLASIGASIAKRDWERAAIVSMVCARGKPGRPSKNARNSRAFSDKFSIRELADKGVYGLQSQDSIRAYLKAWDKSGLPSPDFGDKVDLPTDDFPSVQELYGRAIDDSPAPAPDAIDEGTDDDATEDEEEGQDEPASPRPSPTPRPQVTMLDQFLKVLDHADPNALVHGQEPGKVELLIKTLESWLESLREAVEE